MKTSKSHFRFLIFVQALGLAAGVHAQPASANPEKSLEDYKRFALSQQADAGRGRELFFNESRLACSKCHTVDGKSGKAGPDLFAIGDKFPRPDLIEAILRPSANIAVGYTTTIVTTQNGDDYTGILQQLNDSGLSLLGADGKVVHLDRSDIKEQRSSSVSLMPEALQAGLTLQEFNDVVEYLTTLRQPENALTMDRAVPSAIPELAHPAAVTPLFEASFTMPRIDGVESGLTGASPIPGQEGAWLVTHQVGYLWLVEHDKLDHDKKSDFLDLVAETYSKTGPNGMLGLAFHPHFLENRKYYLKYQVFEDGGIATTIVERKMSPDFRHDSGESRRLIKIPSPGGDHGGGCVQFGPDGYLYFGMGDSGPHRDPNGNAQNMRLLLGKMARIDVDHREAGREYAVPKDNPFRSVPSARPEIWALGFRNPWRFSFDSRNGDLWVADVGQDRVEEIDLVRRGGNYGWNIYEGFEPFSNQYRREGPAYLDPVMAYRRKYGNSITGGYVYRGKKAPSFDGVYIFGDYTSKMIFGMKQEKGTLKEAIQIARAPQRIVSFACDEAGEIYVVGFEGRIYKVDLSSTAFDGPVKTVSLKPSTGN